MATVFDTRRFASAVKTHLGKAKIEAYRGVKAAGEEAAEIARGKAPRDSGEMAESIDATPGRDAQGPYSDVTVDPFYSTWVEFGTSRQQARPFIRPAVKAAARKHLRRRR